MTSSSWWPRCNSAVIRCRYDLAYLHPFFPRKIDKHIQNFRFSATNGHILGSTRRRRPSEILRRVVQVDGLLRPGLYVRCFATDGVAGILRLLGARSTSHRLMKQAQPDLFCGDFAGQPREITIPGNAGFDDTLTQIKEAGGYISTMERIHGQNGLWRLRIVWPSKHRSVNRY